MASKTRLLRDDDLRELLTNRSLRVTAQRLTVLRELAKLRVPISHSELTERLSGSKLDRVTIYRTLLSLHEVGILVRTQLGDNTWRFELPRASGQQHGLHPHFICTDCGDVRCLDEGSVTLKGQAAKAEILEVQLRGRCSDCVSG
jgi:Fur family ferric uptake transcriptional regulator